MSPPHLTSTQIERAGISIETAQRIEQAWALELSRWATGSVSDDDFYTVPPLPDTATAAAPGSLLKVEQKTDTALYTIPSATALSRIMYQSRSLQGRPVPATAFVLWPYTARKQPDGSLPVVCWAHGTSGIFAEQAPSHLRGLLHHFMAPFVLALQGYVVVAPDYAGLGVSRTAGGEAVRHEYLANPAHADDLFYAVEAAQKAFPRLSKEFLVFGHSQGGGAAWAAAQRQAISPVEGYLGAVAAAPVTDISKLPSTGPLLGLVVICVIRTFAGLYPDFNRGDILTEEAVRRWDLYSELEAGLDVAFEFLLGIELLKPDWRSNPHIQDFVRLASNGGKTICGPLLVLQGLSDPSIDASTTTQAVKDTCSAYPGSQVQYVTYPGVTHDPILYASQRVWLDWITERFAGNPVDSQYSEDVASAELDQSQYQMETNWKIQMDADLSERILS